MRRLLVLALSCALSTPAVARVLGPESVRLVPALSSPVESFALAGGGDGIVTGPTRTIGWLLIGVGAVAVGVGAKMVNDAGSTSQVALGAIGGGLIAIGAGAIIIWTTGCVSCTTCGIVEKAPKTAPKERYAAADRRPGDRGAVDVAWTWAF